MQQQHMIQNRKEIPGTHFFIYKNKQYPFNFDLFKISSNYFTTKTNAIIESKYIKLLDENEEEKIDIKEDTINNFIQYIQRQPIPLNDENVVILHYLARKYELSELIYQTEEYISTHHSGIALDQLIIHGDDYNFGKDTYEDIISSHLLDYIDDKKIFDLKFTIIYRIIEKYQITQINEQNSIPPEKMSEFLFKCLDKYGKKASILFQNVDISTFGQDKIHLLFNDYSEIFDFHFINKFYMKTLYDAQNELFCLQKKQEKEMTKAIEDIKSAILEQQKASQKKEEEMLNEINKLKSTILEQQKTNQKKDEEMSDEINKLKSTILEQQKISTKKEEEMSNEIKMMKEEINNIKTTILKHEADNKTSKELAEKTCQNQESFEKEFLELKNSFDLMKASMALDNELFRELLNKLDGETQKKVIDIINSFNRNHQFDKISNILAYFSDEIQESSSLKKRIKYIFFPNYQNKNAEKSDNENNNEYSVVGISSDMIEVLFEKDKLKSEKFKKMISVFSEIHIEVKYPSDNYDSIYGTIVELNKSFKTKIKISVFITGIDKTDQKFKKNNFINAVILDSCVKEIISNGNDGSFEECSSLTQITIPSSITKIGNFAFFDCSSLTQITIPSSVTEIGIGVFQKCSSLTHITIPSSLTKIGHSILADCHNLSKITIVPCDEKRIECIEDKFLIMKTESTSENFDTLIWTKPTVNKVDIPPFINQIKGGAFCGCLSLTQITIPSSVTSIGDFAFSGCSSLTQITIPSSVNRSSLSIPSTANVTTF